MTIHRRRLGVRTMHHQAHFSEGEDTSYDDGDSDDERAIQTRSYTSTFAPLGAPFAYAYPIRQPHRYAARPTAYYYRPNPIRRNHRQHDASQSHRNDTPFTVTVINGPAQIFFFG